MAKIAIVQLKASTDKNRNLKKILHYISKAAKHGADKPKGSDSHF